MPKVTIKSIESFSSEDPRHPAKNLLKPPDKHNKWRCAKAGEEQEFVIMSLEEPTVIDRIDVGNYCSSFIGVEVARKGPAKPKFEDLLLTAAFMRPSECRDLKNTNHVRCFAKKDLVESTVSQKWDLIKVVCSQQFNSRVQYGVAFLNLYTPEKEKPTSSKPDPNKPLAGFKFKLRDESPDSDGNSKGSSLFARWKNQTKDQSLTSIKTENGSKKTSKNLVGRNRESLYYDKEDNEKKIEKWEKLVELDKQWEKKLKDFSSNSKREHESSRRSKEKHKDSPRKSKDSPRKQSNDRRESSSSASASTSHKRSLSSDTNKTNHESSSKRLKVDLKPKRFKDFYDLFEDVVFVLSGYQNPERGEIRQKALELGAEYQADWNSRCTHLICAFTNTPKFRQVKGKGKIVNKKWIEECYRQQKRLSWRKYALDSSDRNIPDSEDEVWDVRLKPKSESETTKTSNDIPSTSKFEDIQDKSQEALVIQNEVQMKDIYDMTTEDEAINAVIIANGQCEELKPIFKYKTFYLSASLSTNDTLKLERLITLFKGKLNDISDGVDYFVSIDDSPMETVDNKVTVVRPEWVYECGDMELIVPLKN